MQLWVIKTIQHVSEALLVDQAFLPAISTALRENEIGDQSPYLLSYARLGSSGGSFGVFQGDCHADPRARNALSQVLQTARLASDQINRIVGAVSLPCPDGSPLSPDDQAAADAALSSDAGKVIVDRMDGVILAVILEELDTVLEAAQSVPISIAAAAQIPIALWVNMTGAPTSLVDWVKGATIGGVAPPSPPTVTRLNVSTYLAHTKFFTLHPRNLIHFEASVDAGVRQLAQPVALAVPAVVPMPGAAAPFADRIVDIAEGEWRFFGQQTYDIAGHATSVGHKEGEDRFYQRIGTYWLDGTNTHGLDGRDHDSPWSAAFISWVMKTGGAGSAFRCSTQHSVYIDQAIRDQQNGRAAAGFWGWRLNEYQPRKGDLVCWARQSGIDYDHQNGGVYAGHSDIVVEVQDGQIFVIGGNVGDSVTRRPLLLNDDGYLVPPASGESLFAIMQNRIP